MSRADLELAKDFLPKVLFESTDGSAFAGSRTAFTVTNVSTGESHLVAVEGTVLKASSTLVLLPGSYRVAPAADAQVSETASYSVRDLTPTEFEVPDPASVVDLAVPVATVRFGLDVQRSPFDLRVDSVSTTSAALIWQIIGGADIAFYELRLTNGTRPAAGPADGVAVALASPTATSAIVEGLQPDATYTVTLFATSNAGELLASRSVSATTAPADGTRPAYALAPNTILPTDFAALEPQLRSDGLVEVSLDASAARSSVTTIPGIDADRLATGCVVGTPMLVSTEVAGDKAFYGVIAGCPERPASWRSQAVDVARTVALVDTGVPLARVVPYLSIRSSGFDRCVVQAGAKPADPNAKDAQASGDLCAAADADKDGVGDSTELALGMNPNDAADDWKRHVTSQSVAALPARPGPKGCDVPAVVVAVACSWDGSTMRLVAALEDVDGDGRASLGDVVKFFEHPTKLDAGRSGAVYKPIPFEDCVVTSFEGRADDFTGPPDLRVQGNGCEASFRSDRDGRQAQDRFVTDNRRAKPSAENRVHIDVLDAIGSEWRGDWIEVNGTKSFEDPAQARKGDDAFLQVEFHFTTVPVGRPNTWRRPLNAVPAVASAIQALPSAMSQTVLVAPKVAVADTPGLECEAAGESLISPGFGLDKFHDIRELTLKYTKLTWDIEAGVTAYVDPYIKVTGEYSCSLDLPGVAFQLTTTPVPLNLELKPVVEGGVSAAFELSGPRLELTLGVHTAGYVDAGTKKCSVLWGFADVPCGIEVDTSATAEPIARFTHEGVTVALEGEARLGAGVEATIGVGVKNEFVTAKNGFAITMEPLVGTVKVSGAVAASATDPATPVSAASTTPDAAAADAAEVTSLPPFEDPGLPYGYHLEAEQLWVAQLKDPLVPSIDGKMIAGPTMAGACFDKEAPFPWTLIDYSGEKAKRFDNVAICRDARCLDTGASIATWQTGCAKARCYLGRIVVNAGRGGDSVAECPQGPVETSLPKTDFNGRLTVVPHDWPGASPSPSASQSAAGGPEPAVTAKPAVTAELCAATSVGASLKVDFRAEFWVLGWGTDERYPLWESDDLTYPGAEFKVGDGCD